MNKEKMLEIIEEIHNSTKQKIEANRKALPNLLFEGTANRDEFINKILSALPDKKKELEGFIGVSSDLSEQDWRNKVAALYSSSVFVTSPERLCPGFSEQAGSDSCSAMQTAVLNRLVKDCCS